MVYHSFQTIIIPALISFLVTIVGTRFIMSYFYGAGIIAEDRNKARLPRLPGSGGVAVAFGIVVGILVYAFGGSFMIYVPVLSISNLMAVALAIVLISFGGFLDDVNVKSKRVQVTGMMGINEGLKQWQKPLLTLLGALPLIAINAGVSTVTLPFLGTINFGIFYPLIILPLAIIFVPNAINLLGGFNGLEAGMALVASIGFLIYSVYFGSYTGAFLSTILAASLAAFLLFNVYPAKILPGDSLTYTIGGTIVAIMVMGNAEIFGIIVLMPWIIEFLLHARRKWKVTDLGVRQRDGTLSAPYGRKIYSLTHIVMNLKRVREYEVSIYLAVLEAVFVLLALGLKVYHFL